MKSIKKKSHSFWMLGSFAIIVLLFLLLLSKTPKVITKDTIEAEEVMVLLKALDEEKEATFETFFSEYINQESKGKVTYQFLKQAMNILDNTFSQNIVGNVASDNLVDRENFFSIYEKLIKECKKSEEIMLEEVGIVGISTDNMQTCLVTDKDWGYCEEEVFQEYVGYRAKTYVKKTEQKKCYLTVKEVMNGTIELPYTYVLGQNEDGIHFIFQNKEVLLPQIKYNKISGDVIATLTLKQGKVQKVEEFTEKINDKVLSINNVSVTLEKEGTYDFCEDMKIYKLFDGLSQGDISDVALGYEFVDFVIHDEKICACLIVMNEGMDSIRVLIKNTNFLSEYHQEVVLCCDSSYKIYENGENPTEYEAYEDITISMESIPDDVNYKIVPDTLTGKVIVKSIERNQGNPQYSGTLELSKKEAGIVVINEVLLEEYLYNVVPSEMPSYFQKEALMAQAICARTYAYTKMKNAGLKELGAHLDDSTSFQVYNNIDEQISTTSAVRETAGMILKKDSVPVETQYYSTSSGVGTNGLRLNQSTTEKVDLSTNAAFDAYIQNKCDTDFECSEGLYRWSYETNLDAAKLESRLKECYNKNKNQVLYLKNEMEYVQKNQYENLGQIEKMMVVERSQGGRAEKLFIQGSEQSVLLIGEYNIRYTLCNQESKVVKQDGTTMELTTLLPSAFFEIETSQKEKMVVGYSLTGGGFGHGNGMSQNGAGNMAKMGYSHIDILQLFYENSILEKIY